MKTNAPISILICVCLVFLLPMATRGQGNVGSIGTKADSLFVLGEYEKAFTLGKTDSSAVLSLEKALRNYFPDFEMGEMKGLEAEEHFRMHHHLKVISLLEALAAYGKWSNQPDITRKALKHAINWQRKVATRTAHPEVIEEKDTLIEKLVGKLLETELDLFQQGANSTYAMEAFAYSNVRKDQILNTYLHSKRNIDFRDVSQADIDDGKALLESYLKAERRALEADSSSASEKLTRAYKDAKKAYLDWQHDLAENSPAYFDLMYGHPLPYPDSVKQWIEMDSTLVIDFTWTARGMLYRTAFDEAKTILLGDSIPSDASDSIQAFIDLLRDPGAADPAYAGEVSARYEALGYKLYEFLLQDVVNSFPNGTYKRLLIIPDKTLRSLPFEALLNSGIPAEERDSLHLPYLLRDYAIRMEYSASQVHVRGGPGRHPKFPYLGIAPAFSKNYRRRLSDPRDSLASISRVSFNQDEVIQSYKVSGGRVFRGEYAKEEKVKDYMDHASLLHFATHTLLNDTSPLLTSLVLREDEAGNDGLLHAYEIYPRKLSAHLAILNASERGSSRWRNGEAMFSLSRALEYAGCTNTLMDLWQVDHPASSEILASFLENLKDGMAKDMALQKAKVDFLTAEDTEPFPHFWASLVLVGDDKGVDFHTELPINSIWIWALGLGGIFALVLFLRRRKKKSKKT